MAKRFISVMVLVLALLAGRIARAEEPTTFVRVLARTDLSGRTEIAIHKAYSGQLGPIQDIISLQSPDPDGYPKAEILTSGSVRATRETGKILVESTGPGPGAVDVFITHDRLQATQWLQMAEAPGVGPMWLNVGVGFGEGLHAAREGNHLLVRGPDGQEQKLKERADARGWSVNADIPAGSMMLIHVAGERDPVAPLWLTQVSLALALLSLALSAFLILKSRPAVA